VIDVFFDTETQILMQSGLFLAFGEESLCSKE